MALKKLTFQPGLFRDLTRYASEGAWYNAQWVRFVRGFPQKMGGWTAYLNKNVTANIIGIVRALFVWVDLAGVQRMAIGTNQRYYVEIQGGVNNITPIRLTATLANNPFAVTSGLTLMVVTHTAHGAVTGAYVTYSGATSGLTHPTAGELNQTFVITVIDVNSYSVTLPVAASSTSAGFGGAAVSAAYEINPGNSIATSGLGWGSGPYSRGTWSSAYAAASSLINLRLWSQDHFGEDLVFNYRQGPVFYYDSSVGGRGVDITTLSGDAPQSALYVFVADVERYLIVLGTNDTGGAVFDPMLVRWASQESLTVWTPAVTNTAGSLPVTTGDFIVAGTHTRNENLIWTNTALYSLQFVGGQNVFGLNLIGKNITIASQNAFVTSRDKVFWMGQNCFYMYDGVIRTMDCPLQQTVFNNFNYTQQLQVYCGEIRKFNEIVWFFCSLTATLNDRYIIYNYEQNVWYDGAISRTAWLDTAQKAYPVAATGSALLYHEFGVDDTSGAGTVAIPAYIQSADTDIDDGEDFMFVKRVIPDVDFSGSIGSPQITLTAVPRFAPGDGTDTSSTPSATVTSTGVLDLYTDQIYVRLRSRQMALRVDSTGVGVMWRLGATRVDAQADGRQ